MQYDFETVWPDRTSDCRVYDLLRAEGVTEADAVPFGVAEMMFPIAPPIREALRKVADEGYFGYRQNEAPFRRAVCRWMAQKGVTLAEDMLFPVHGVVTALGDAVRTLTKPGDPIVIQPPVYGPFYAAIEKNGRTLVENPLAVREGRYEMDLADLEEKLKATGAKLLILCSPHNPVGRVWEKRELEALHAVCARYGTAVFADEIHQDILPFGAVQTPYATIDPTCLAAAAASKTFNIAGLSTSYMYSLNTDLLARCKAAAERDNGDFFDPAGLAATTAAYEHCADWMREMLAQVADNIQTVGAALAPTPIRMIMPEGTYLCWLDMRALGRNENQLGALLTRAGLSVTRGTFFGPAGAGFVRFNAACPKAALEKGLARLCAQA